MVLLLLSGCIGLPWIRDLEVFKEAGILEGNLQNINIQTPDSTLPDFEKLSYDVKWMGLRVGTLTTSILGIRDYNGRPAYVLEATMKTNKFLSKIYKIEDRFVSYMDSEKLYTLRSEVYRKEGKYRKDAVIEFDQENHKAHFKNFVDNTEKDFEIPLAAHDILSAYYHLMLLPLKLGDRVQYYVTNNEKNYQFVGFIHSKVSIRMPVLGKKETEAFLLLPNAKLKGEALEKGSASAYFSCEKRRIPLLATVKGPVFTEVSIYLSKIENGK
jgi:hypothetical protein